MNVAIEVLAISELREWGDRQVAFKYSLGHKPFQEGWLIETVNDDWLDITFMLPKILAQRVNCTRPQGLAGRWL